MTYVLDGEVPIVVDSEDGPSVTVLDPAAAGGPHAALIAPGDDDISDRGAVAGGQWDLSPIDSAVEQEPVGAGSLVESPHGVG